MIHELHYDKNSIVMDGSDGVLCGNVTHDVEECSLPLVAITLPPHKFIQITGKLVNMASLHALHLPFNPIPVRLHMLCMRSIGSDKLNTG